MLTLGKHSEMFTECQPVKNKYAPGAYEVALEEMKLPLLLRMGERREHQHLVECPPRAWPDVWSFYTLYLLKSYRNLQLAIIIFTLTEITVKKRFQMVK
jgi:hypothetical protein